MAADIKIDPILELDGEHEVSKSPSKKKSKKRDEENSKLVSIYEDEDQIYSLKELVSS